MSARRKSSAKDAEHGPAELDILRRRLAEAEETIDAIRSGGVDAFMVGDEGDEHIRTLRGADRPFQVLVESMLQGALILADDATVLYANRRVSDLIGIAHEKLTADKLTRWITPECRPAFEELLDNGFTTDSRADLDLLRADGSTCPVHITASRLPLDATAALTVTLTDLTSAKEHAALEKAHVQARASETKLLIADRRKDEFFATIATELRNPLGPVRNLVEVLRRKGAATPDVEWAQNVIDRQVQRMARLVDELLDLSGIAHDRIELQRERVALQDVVEAAHDRCATLFEEWGHEVVIALPDETVMLDADPVRLAKVFENLLTNAANYSNRFGRIEIEGTVGEGSVVVTVRDNGAGIPAEQLPHIFDMFARLDRSVRGEQTSLGIGLALVKRVVDLHGGTIEARSEGTGKGSAFIITLPLAASTGDAAPEGASSVAGRRIMIVDDHADGADALATMLRLYGNEVRAVYQGAEAMAIGAGFEPDTVLLDLGMPGMDGYEVCSLIRGSSWGDRAHVIAITGRSHADDRRRTFEAGFDRHLVKPVDPATLASVLSSLPPRRPSPMAGISPSES